MASTPSTMLDLGTAAPNFALVDVRSGEIVSLSDFQEAAGLLVAFWCNHCPYVKHIEEAFVEFAAEVMERGVGVIAISSNDVAAYPQDGPEAMAELAHDMGYGFPYLHDETQEVATAFQAACTPDFFLFDETGELYYRGQFDASRPSGSAPVDGRDLRAAVDALLIGDHSPGEQVASLGCNIKWIPGQEPAWSIRV